MSSNKRSSKLTALIGLLGLTSCTTPRHTDLLVFGTNTQFGVAVSADSTSNPGVNIGYKRQEVVLMPLFVNGTGRTAALPAPPDQNAVAASKYVGSDGSPDKTDTYSVLASFGAKGGGDTTGKAEVKIAQYFATGLAARTLAYAGGALINTSDKAAASAPETAKAAAAAEQSDVVDALNLGIARFTAEGKLQDAFNKLKPAQSTSFLAKLNQALNRGAANTITAANLQTQLASFNEAEIAFASNLMKKP